MIYYKDDDHIYRAETVSDKAEVKTVDGWEELPRSLEAIVRFTPYGEFIDTEEAADLTN